MQYVQQQIIFNATCFELCKLVSLHLFCKPMRFMVLCVVIFIRQQPLVDHRLLTVEASRSPSVRHTTQGRIPLFK